MRAFFLCFVPLFVAVNAIGVLPTYLSLTSGLGRPQIRRVIVQSILTATIVAFIFLFIGQGIFRLLGITVADFMVAGGVLLFVISMRDLLARQQPIRLDADTLGAVPIGVPLIVGPAVLTTVLLLADQHGHLPTLLATFVNILIAGIFFWGSGTIHRALGKAGTRTVSKIANLILAAIAVMIMRKGIMAFVVH